MKNCKVSGARDKNGGKKLESVDARAATIKRRFRTFQLNGHQHRKFAKSGEKKKEKKIGHVSTGRFDSPINWPICGLSRGITKITFDLDNRFETIK